MASPVGLGLRDVLRLDEHDRHAAALCSAGVLAGGNCAVAKLPPKPKGDRYVLEYRGELLCVDILLMADSSSALASPALGSSIRRASATTLGVVGAKHLDRGGDPRHGGARDPPREGDL